jgi:hypothetical protein
MTNKNLKRLIYNKKTEKYLVNSQIISIFATQYASLTLADENQ